MAEVSQRSIEDFYLKQKRKQSLKNSRVKSRQDQVNAVSKQSNRSDQDTCTSNDVLYLKAFDLDYKYGPAAGISRAERWKRAEKLGLGPDHRIMQLIQQNPNNNVYIECLWEGTLVAE